MTWCYDTYAEVSSSEGEDDWNEASGPRLCLGNAGDMRSYCECGRPLRRVAKIPIHVALLSCRKSKACIRCDESILPGDLHFRCRECRDVKVCKDCGPGVYIEHTFDFFDARTQERDILDVPDRVLHERKAKQLKRKNSRKRGLVLQPTNPEDQLANRIAEQVVSNSQRIMQQVMAEGVDVRDADWPVDIFWSLVGASSAIQAFEATRLLVSCATRQFAYSETLQKVKAPCKIYGDLHGQLRDLMLLFGTFGFPGSPESPSVVFNGDFVDRGRHQVEVLCVLFALRILYPQQVFLNRGNHEDSHMNRKYGFAKTLSAKFGEACGDQLFSLISDSFDMLPLASLVDDKILVVHGGIGDGKWALDDLRAVRRPLQHSDLQDDSNQWLYNLLWSDPIEDDSSSKSRVFGVHSSPRSKYAVKFGWNVTQAFCAQNGLDLVVRSHQAKKGGLGFDVMHNESLIRVFSARDYEGHDNDCAVLSVFRVEEEQKDDVLIVRPQVLSSLTHG